jgi:tRNA pseudouridine38-40 synthase
VQGVLEAALEPMAGSVRLLVAGRTDAGVHAEHQVASFDPDRPVRVQRLAGALTGLLGPEIVVRRASLAPAGFDARRSATAREYRYRVRTGPWPDPFTASFEWHRPGRLDVSRMRRAARHLVGEHDFASFCRRPPQGSTVRTLHRLAVRVRGDHVEVRATADAFLHQMVRSLVGTLVSVGVGAIDPDALPSILAARSRAAAGPVAPPQGLVLVRVTYGRRQDGGRSTRSA